MPASLLTNFARASLGASFFANTDSDGAAVPATFYIILIDSSFPGFSGNNTNPDIKTASQITGAVNPSAYTGNGVARSSVGFTVAQDDTNDRGVVSFTTPPVLTAAGTISNAKGYAICTENNITTGKVVSIQRFSNGPFSLSAAQTLTINGASMIIGG